jgi:hypothetical protein
MAFHRLDRSEQIPEAHLLDEVPLDPPLTDDEPGSADRAAPADRVDEADRRKQSGPGLGKRARARQRG